MSRTMSPRRIALVASLVAAPAFAQVGGVWPGPNATPPGLGVSPVYGSVWPGGYYGYYPNYYRGGSSWSNGYTLYGPPTPTYGITPGAFGGADYRLNNGGRGYGFPGTPLGVGVGVQVPLTTGGRAGGWANAPVGTPSAPPVYTAPPASSAVPAGPAAPNGPLFPPAPNVAAAAADTAATVDVRLPADAATAEVFVNDTKTAQAGVRRIFRSPALKPGETGSYDIKATWVRDGQPVTQTRTVNVTAGEVAVADFTR